MSITRVEEIVDSLGVINVTYKTVPVWIEQFNRENKTARVKNLSSNEIFDVSINDLVES